METETPASSGLSMDTSADASIGNAVFTLPQLAQLIDNIKHIEPEYRLAAVRELPVIGSALGPERTRKELLPYLLDSLDDDDDVLLALAEELKDFVPKIGGPKFAHHLLPLFEAMASSEEAIIRNKAVLGLSEIIGVMPVDTVIQGVIPLVQKLSSAHWFSSRSSACGLYPSVLASIPDEAKAKILGLYSQLATDATPMVRRAAAKSLESIVPTIPEPQVKEVVVPLFHKFAEDDQDSVRLLSVPVVAPLVQALNHADMMTVVLPALLALAHDSSWRVRYMVADYITKVQAVVTPKVVLESIAPVFLELLADGEAEVRTVISTKVIDFCMGLPEEARISAIETDILPHLQNIVQDESPHVRAALASVIMGLAPILGRERTIESLLPLYLVLLKDEFSDVRLNIISNLDNVNRVIGISQLSRSLLPAIYELAVHTSWRVRVQIIEYVPLVAKQLGPEFFNDELMGLCMSWLQDLVASVRKAAMVLVHRLIGAFGIEWARDHVIPKILEMAHEKYLGRLTTLLAVNNILDVCNPETVAIYILPVVCHLHKDKIPNVRFNVAKTLTRMIELLDVKTLESQVRPVLAELAKDQDVDVQFFTHTAQKALDARSGSTVTPSSPAPMESRTFGIVSEC